MARISDLTVNGDTLFLGNTYGNLSGRATNADKADLADNATHADAAAAAESLTYKCMQTVFSRIYPVGSVYISMNNTDPGSLFGGTWKRISQGRMLLGANDTNYKLGSTGGEETHTLTANEMPRHSHSGTTSRAELTGDFRCRSNTFYGNGVTSVIGNNTTTGVFSVRQSGLRSEGNADDNRTEYICHFDGSHSHTMNLDEAGKSIAHNNMSPYLACYIWQRTA